MILRIFVSLVLMAVGFWIVTKTLSVLEIMGSSPFGEKYFGSSGNFYKLIGVLIILVGFLVLTNLHGKLILWVFGFVG